MPNFNGAIIVHTLQLLNSPATLREIVVTIAKNTELPQDELKAPVKQTLEMGHRLGFLQKLDGRYFLVKMTFDALINEMHALDKEEILEKPKIAKNKKKLVQKSPLLTGMDKKASKKPVKNPEPVVNVTKKAGVQDIASSSNIVKQSSPMLIKPKRFK